MRIRQKSKRRRRVILAASILMALGILADIRLRPHIQTVCEVQARSHTARAIDTAIEALTAVSAADYRTLVSVETDNEGRIRMLRVDTAAVNALRALAAEAILAQMTAESSRAVEIRLGALTGMSLLMGRGPVLTVPVTITSGIAANLESRFESAGINQTKHQLILTVHMTVASHLPGYPAAIEVEGEYLIAETVLVGDVPDIWRQ